MAHADWVRAYAALVARHRDRLNELDAAIGDADHGSNMHRGLVAAVTAVDAAPAASGAELLHAIGVTFVSTVGGASGPLFGGMFARMGTSLGDRTARHGAREPDTELAMALRAGLTAVVARGSAEPGDKTMVDALAPAVETFAAATARGAPIGVALRAAAAAASAGRDATIAMTARKGRASYLGSRSAGHQDPGATSVALFFQAATDVHPARQQRWDRPAPPDPTPHALTGGTT